MVNTSGYEELIGTIANLVEVRSMDVKTTGSVAKGNS